mgnify:CR=1 FL=1
MSPTKGRIVMFRFGSKEVPLSGSFEHPAIITRVWSDTMVNLLVFVDNAAPMAVTSIELHAEEPPHTGQRACWWPARA